jgi:hypothetical protein
MKTQREFIEYLNQFIDPKIDVSKFSDDFLNNSWYSIDEWTVEHGGKLQAQVDLITLKHDWRKSLFQFLDSLEDATDDFDLLCDCDYDGKLPGDDKFGHSINCRTMNARRDVEELLKKFGG